jgi:hypothetical protein
VLPSAAAADAAGAGGVGADWAMATALQHRATWAAAIDTAVF